MRKENCLQIAYFNGFLIGTIKAELLVHTHVFVHACVGTE